ncbi:MAG: TIGR02594 family protein [Flavobacteriaceae bacterium]
MEAIKIALTQYGVQKNDESEIHPQIIEYFTVIGYTMTDFKKNNSWSSAFVNWVAKKSGYEYSGKLDARSWLGVGNSIDTPEWGDIVVLWKDIPENKDGYVGVFIKETRRYVYLLGGDQRNSVCIKAYPKSRVLDYRRLRKIAS